MADALRLFIHATLLELRTDPRMMAMLRGTGMREPETASGRFARALADEWCEGIEMELGHPVAPGHRVQVSKFVAKRWPGLLKRFGNDHRAAKQTLNNILDTKFSGLRLGD